MWLPYRIAFQIAIALALVVVALHRVRGPRVRVVVATAKELTIVMLLYTIWQYVRRRAITKTAGAMDNARWLWDLQQSLHLPSEAAFQEMFIDNRPVMWFMNVYYGGFHVPAAGILLLWVFFRHRDKYSAIRATFALTIAGCITIQALVPMAPPRFLTEYGFVDAGLKYNLSVYGRGGSGVSNELAAMPSLHVGWAVLVGVAAVLISNSRWRWLVLLHPVLTVLSITLTANHWWLDGVVAVMVLAAAYAIQHVAIRAGRSLVERSRWRRSLALGDPDDADIVERPLVDVA